MNPPYRHTPERLTEQPPADRFCDLVLNGGVASGVVYPWALLELARHYRFKSIGGNSVGAIAACVAAAAEYGRCRGVENAFEPLRRIPLELADVDGGDGSGRTGMLRLFQPHPKLRRAFALFLMAVGDPPGAGRSWMVWVLEIVRRYSGGRWFVGLMLAVLALTWGASGPFNTALTLIAGTATALLLLLGRGLHELRRDLRALAANGYGLCTGRSQVDQQEGLVEWLHRGIQLSAGRGPHDPPLTFADLWGAPRFGRPGPSPQGDGRQPPDAAINLQMFSSNVTLGRAVRLPLNDPDTRLYYDPEEWRPFFPDSVLVALDRVSVPYRPRSSDDPSIAAVPAGLSLRELPSGDLPIVVAARLSLCFPFLFSCVPVYAIDEEQDCQVRVFTRCLLSDGGLCTNFPIHLFDTAHPRWPTFGILLGNRSDRRPDIDVALSDTHDEGRVDRWHRQVPGGQRRIDLEAGLLRQLWGLLTGMAWTMKDWNDRAEVRMPHVRARVIRVRLKKREGQLNLSMPRGRILDMAYRYGTLAGQELVSRFGPQDDEPTAAWREHVYVRSMIELRALRRHLRGFTQSLQAVGPQAVLRAHSDAGAAPRQLRRRPRRHDPSGAALTPGQGQAIERAMQAVQALEAELAATESEAGPYEPLPEPELRLRPPV